MRPLGGQKPMAVKTVPQKLPLYKTFDKIIRPQNKYPYSRGAHSEKMDNCMQFKAAI